MNLQEITSPTKPFASRFGHLWFLFAVCIGVQAFAQQEQQLEELYKDARATKAAYIAAAPEMAKLFEKSHGYAIFPNVGKGGLLLGVTAGNGMVWENGKVIGTAKLREVSFGLQLGGQAFSQVIFYDSDEAFSRIKANKVEFRAQAAALADSKSASTDINMAKGILVIVKPKKGLMGEAAIGGQKFSFTRLKPGQQIKQENEDLVRDYF